MEWKLQNRQHKKKVHYVVVVERLFSSELNRLLMKDTNSPKATFFLSKIRKKNDCEISDILFLEEIEFVCLSETKFLDFVSSFDFNDMSGQLWQNLCQYSFHIQSKSVNEN